MLKTADELIREAQQQIECVDALTARQIFNQNENVLIVDVRDADSAGVSKLNQSINISRGLLEMKLPKQCEDSEQMILTHCGGGGRASLAAYTLQQMGYSRVYAITAPFDEIKRVFDSAT